MNRGQYLRHAQLHRARECRALARKCRLWLGSLETRTSLRFVVQAATRVPGLVTSITMTFVSTFFFFPSTSLSPLHPSFLLLVVVDDASCV
ncbi:hypothetical protein V8C43DRAFT_285077 [Trichoderma afarasin]